MQAANTTPNTPAESQNSNGTKTIAGVIFSASFAIFRTIFSQSDLPSDKANLCATGIGISLSLSYCVFMAVKARKTAQPTPRVDSAVALESGNLLAQNPILTPVFSKVSTPVIPRESAAVIFDALNQPKENSAKDSLVSNSNSNSSNEKSTNLFNRRRPSLAPKDSNGLASKEDNSSDLLPEEAPEKVKKSPSEVSPKMTTDLPPQKSNTILKRAPSVKVSPFNINPVVKTEETTVPALPPASLTPRSTRTSPVATTDITNVDEGAKIKNLNLTTSLLGNTVGGALSTTPLASEAKLEEPLPSPRLAPSPRHRESLSPRRNPGLNLA